MEFLKHFSELNMTLLPIKWLNNVYKSCRGDLDLQKLKEQICKKIILERVTVIKVPKNVIF